MQRPSGNAAVRLSIWTLLIASFAMALVQPVQAGTEEAPEVQDPADDQVAADGVPVSEAGFAAADVITAWVEEDATNLLLNIRASGAINGGSAQGTPTTQYAYTFHLSIAETETLASAVVVFPATATPGDATTAAVVNDTLLTMTVPKSAIGNPAAGVIVTGIFVEAEVLLPPLPAPIVTDRAPDEGNGGDYTITGGSGTPASDPNDTDGDGLNDTWEQQYFGNTTAENATGDPDGDGLTNGQEEALGTDPTEADTDGDGTNDQDDPAPTDPSVGGNTTTTTSSSTSSSSSSSTSSTTSSSSTTTGAAGGGTSDGDVENLDDAIERLEADPAYLGMSAGGLLAVLVLSIIALAVRWSL